MKTFDCKRTLKNIKGDELNNVGIVKQEGQEAITLGEIIADVLASAREDHARSYVFAKKFATQDTVDLKAEDIVFVQQKVEKSGLPALTVGQIIEELEGTVE